jgi:hypothetical protein
MPELPGSLDLEEPRPTSVRLAGATLDQLALAHHAQHPLAVHRPAQLALHPGGHDPIAVGRVLLGDLDDRPLDLVDRRPPGSVRCPARAGDRVGRLAADLKYTRHDCRAMPGGHELTGVGDAFGHSHVRNPFPKSSSS